MVNKDYYYYYLGIHDSRVYTCTVYTITIVQTFVKLNDSDSENENGGKRAILCYKNKESANTFYRRTSDFRNLGLLQN